MDWNRILRRRRVMVRAVQDIVVQPRRAKVVRLRERAWKLEISASAFVRALSRHRVRSAVAVALVAALSIGLLRGVGRANVATLYATSCLGGWVNPQLAEGKPDLAPDSDPELFTAKNSSALDGAISQIYCGSFRGEVPPDTRPKKVVLNFSWAVLSGYAGGLGSSGGSAGEPNAPNVDVLHVDAQATPQEQVEALLQAQESDAVQVEDAPVPEDGASSSPVDSGAQLAPEPQAEVSRLPFVAVARAQEEAAAAEQPAEAPVEPAAELRGEELDPAAPTATLEPEGELPTTGEQPVDPLPVAPQATPEDTEPAFLEVSYTIDGQSWVTLAKVSAKSWRGLALELPLESWDELATVQVSLQAVPTVAEQPQVLLDGVYLAVTYGDDAANVQDQPDFSRDTVLQLQADGDVNLLKVYSASRQHQQLWTYQAAGNGTWTLLVEEPELDPVANAAMRNGLVAWVTRGAGSVALAQFNGAPLGSQTIGGEVPVDLPLSDGVLLRWDGSSLAFVAADGTATDAAPPKEAAVFLSEVGGAAALAATAVAPVELAPAVDVALPQEVDLPTDHEAEPTSASSTEPLAPAVSLPPEPPILTAE